MNLREEIIEYIHKYGTMPNDVQELGKFIDDSLKRLEEYKWCVKCSLRHDLVRDLNKCPEWDFGHYWVTEFKRVEKELK